MTLAYFYLALAIFFEVLGTSFLKLTVGFSKLLPSAVVVFAYLVSLYFMTLSIRTLPIGLVYAIWAGTGIAAIAIIGVVFFKETVDWQGITGIGFIIAGVVVLNAFSRMGNHG
jgi:small multidrug resistance pump